MAGDKLEPSPLTWLGGERRLARRVGRPVREFLAIEAKRARRKEKTQLDAWECLMRGRAHLWKLGHEDGLKARELFQRALQDCVAHEQFPIGGNQVPVEPFFQHVHVGGRLLNVQ